MLGANVYVCTYYHSPPTNDWIKSPIGSLNITANISVFFIFFEKPLLSQLSRALASLQAAIHHRSFLCFLETPHPLLFLCVCCLCWFLDLCSSSFLVYFIVSLRGPMGDTLELENIIFHLHTKLDIKFVDWELFPFRILKVLLYCLQASSSAAKSNNILIIGSLHRIHFFSPGASLGREFLVYCDFILMCLVWVFFIYSAEHSMSPCSLKIHVLKARETFLFYYYFVVVKSPPFSTDFYLIYRS